MTLASSGIASLRQFHRWFTRRVLQQRSWMDGSPYWHEKALLDKIRCDAYETLSSFCFDKENIIESVADARERFLKPGARIIPESGATFLLPFSSDSFGVGRFVATGPANRRSFYDLDYRPLAKKLLNEWRLVRASDKPLLALSEPALCYHIDFQTETRNPGKAFVPFPIRADGRLDGFLGWFELRLCEGVSLSNSPYLPLTHWWQLYFPAAEQPQYHTGQMILLYLDPNFVAGEAEWHYSVRVTS